MRAFQFWVLFFGSLVVSGLLVKQIFLSRAIISEQHILVDNREIASTGEAYQTTWKELAVHIYQGSRQDPPLAAILKTERVNISTTPPASILPPPAPSPLSSKSPTPTFSPSPSTP
jgi:hypothetical protein